MYDQQVLSHLVSAQQQLHESLVNSSSGHFRQLHSVLSARPAADNSDASLFQTATHILTNSE